MDSFQLGVEISLSVLLLITIFYSLYLGRALTVLRRDRSELNTLISTLQASSSQAQSGIDHLRQTTERVGRTLGRTVESGKELKAELKELCDRAELLLGRLDRPAVSRTVAPTEGKRFSDGAVRESLTASPAGKIGNVPEGKMVKKPVGKSAAERELLHALRQKQG